MDNKPTMSIDEILLPEATRRIAKLKDNTNHLVHYASAETGLKILKSHKIWMRNALVMNDFSEISYGNRCVQAAIDKGLMQRIKAAIDPVFPLLCDELFRSIAQRFSRIREHTYMICVSEHPTEEDKFGRLSMWRAYGGKAGIALVFDKSVLFSEKNRVPKAISTPVAYLTEAEFIDRFEEVVKNIEANPSVLAAFGAPMVESTLRLALNFSVLSTKHPAFEEEREWRVVYNPADFGDSPVIPFEAEIISGVAQIVCKLPLDDMNVIRRIIIGPCNDALTMQHAFTRLLYDAGVQDAANRVVRSDIPLRHPS